MTTRATMIEFDGGEGHEAIVPFETRGRMRVWRWKAGTDALRSACTNCRGTDRPCWRHVNPRLVLDGFDDRLGSPALSPQCGGCGEADGGSTLQSLDHLAMLASACPACEERWVRQWGSPPSNETTR